METIQMFMKLMLCIQIISKQLNTLNLTTHNITNVGENQLQVVLMSKVLLLN